MLFREHRRVQVAPLTVSEIVDTYALRILTEGFAVSESVRRRPAEIAGEAEAISRRMLSDATAGDGELFYRRHLDFHRAIYAGAGSQELARVTEDLRTRTDRHGTSTGASSPATCAPPPMPTLASSPPSRRPTRMPPPGSWSSTSMRTALELLAQAGAEQSSLLDRCPRTPRSTVSVERPGPAGVSVDRGTGGRRIRRRVIAEEVAARIEELIIERQAGPRRQASAGACARAGAVASAARPSVRASEPCRRSASSASSTAKAPSSQAARPRRGGSWPVG